MTESFPNAMAGFSEILLIGRENHQSYKNRALHDVNAWVLEYCDEKDLVYIKYSKLQSPNAGPLFDDDVHVSDIEGSVVLVSNIQRAPQRSWGPRILQS